MRTTVDLDPDLHREAVARARGSRISLSKLLNDALRQSLHPLGPVQRDPLTGLGTITIGRQVSADEVADVLDDD